MAERTCKHCGKSLSDTRQHATGPLPGYCSKRCRQLRYDTKPERAAILERRRLEQRAAYVPVRVENTCCVCDRQFESSRMAKYCSKPCERRGPTLFPTRLCEVKDCGRPHCAKGLCSMHWKAAKRERGEREPKPWNDRRRDEYHRRRAMKRGASTGRPVILSEIAARDGWRCGICGKRVSQTAKWPNRRSASIDHIVPLSLDGEHDPLNCQLAHLGCNTSKGNRVGEVQLALVG